MGVCVWETAAEVAKACGKKKAAVAFAKGGLSSGGQAAWRSLHLACHRGTHLADGLQLGIADTCHDRESTLHDLRRNAVVVAPNAAWKSIAMHAS